MAFRIIRENIINVEADAIVNTANPRPVFGSGTDTAVYEAAGKEKLLRAREAIGVIGEGEAAATPAFGLHAKIIIHTVSPLWIDGNHHEIELLHRCYQNCFALAQEQDCLSIAFPLLASGSNGFEKSTALEVALSEIQNYTMRHDMDVLLVVFDKTSYALSEKVFADVVSYIEEHQVLEAQDMEYGAYPRERRRGRKGKLFHMGRFGNDREKRFCFSLPKIFAPPLIGRENSGIWRNPGRHFRLDPQAGAKGEAANSRHCVSLGFGGGKNRIQGGLFPNCTIQSSSQTVCAIGQLFECRFGEHAQTGEISLFQGISDKFPAMQMLSAVYRQRRWRNFPFDSLSLR